MVGTIVRAIEGGRRQVDLVFMLRRGCRMNEMRHFLGRLTFFDNSCARQNVLDGYFHEYYSTVAHILWSDIVRTELGPAIRLDVCGVSSSKRRFRLGTKTTGLLRIALACSSVSVGGGRMIFFPPGLCLYHVDLVSTFPADPHVLHVQWYSGTPLLVPGGRDIGRRLGRMLSLRWTWGI